MNVAAIDIGTGSLRLLITGPGGEALEREMTITRLGQGVDVSGELHPDAIARSVAVLAQYGALIRKHGVSRVRAAATSAARDARNRDVFFDAAEQALGTRPELMPGTEEARLAFRGATFGLDPAQGPFLIVDIGGGSTELVLGTREPEALVSIDMGSVRMSERHLRHDPASPAELAACLGDVRSHLAEVRAAVPVARARRMIGLAGTINALAHLSLGLRSYSPEQTHHSRLTRARVGQLFQQLAAADVASRRRLLAEPKRAEVIVGGAAILHVLLEELQIAELTVSETDILDGLAASLR